MLNKMKKALKNNKGFTLIEMMVVIVIIAILAAIALPTFSGMLNDARDSAAMSEARNVYTLAYLAEEMQETYTVASISAEAGVDPANVVIGHYDTDELAVRYTSDSAAVIIATNGFVGIDGDTGTPTGTFTAIS